MPSAKILESKKKIVSELHEKIMNATSAVLVDYKGITVEDDTKMRVEMRKADVNYFVVKNSILKLALKDTEYEKMSEVLEGTTSIALSDDAMAGAKIIDTYATKLKTVLEFKAGFIDKTLYEPADLKRIAKIPSKEVLIATMLASFNSPIQKFACCLNQIAQQKSA